MAAQKSAGLVWISVWPDLMGVRMADLRSVVLSLFASTFDYLDGLGGQRIGPFLYSAVAWLVGQIHQACSGVVAAVPAFTVVGCALPAFAGDAELLLCRIAVAGLGEGGRGVGTL